MLRDLKGSNRLWIQPVDATQHLRTWIYVIRLRRPELAESEFGVLQIATDSDDLQTGAEIKQRPSCGECTDSKELLVKHLD